MSTNNSLLVLSRYLIISTDVVVTGNETPLVLGSSKDLTCTAVNIDVAKIEWRFIFAGCDLEWHSASGVNKLIIQPNLTKVGAQMFRCVVKSTSGIIYSQDAPIIIKGKHIDIILVYTNTILLDKNIPNSASLSVTSP